MKKKNILFYSLTSLLLLVSIYFFITPMPSKHKKSLENEVAELNINSNDIVNAYNTNEEKSDSLYAGKIIEVTGIVKEITFLNDRNTIILNSNFDAFGVICDINPNQKEKIKHLKENQKIRVKGICKGFLKDVILLNCSIDLIKNE